MNMSIIIPTRDRTAKVLACLSKLAEQSHAPDRFEVLIGLDGPDTTARHAIEDRAATCPMPVRVVPCPRMGQAGVRNALIAQARGRLLGMLNDDMLPDRLWVAAHVAAHAEAEQRGIAVAIIVGSSPWKRHEPDRLFDRLLRETSMVFFHHRMDGERATDHGREHIAGDANAESAERARWRDWGFRHAWTLNLSVSREAVMRAGGFSIFPSTYGYEDDELAFRLHGAFGSPVLYRPSASAEHDHRMAPDEYLLREYRLGYAALGFARQRPACAVAMFRRDLTEMGGLVYDRAALIREARDVSRLIEPFVAMGEIPAQAITGEHAPALLNLVYQQHLPLKRWAFRRGLIDAAEGRAMRSEMQDVLSLLLEFSPSARAA